ncbi:MAG: ATP-binding cassette domain-containing protein [Lachnospiraceae bacterium]|nr:ATP-binding cassette domain-containing protein [Lachnospiraceae bacterium]
MKEEILSITDMTKKYKNQTALSHVNLRLKKGRIYGLIGQNGAGKTTLMRMVAGLGFPTEGNITLFGKNSSREVEMAEKRVGTMVEYPGLVGGMTAKENMHLQCLMKGIPNYEVEDELLKTVGLADTGRKKVKHFSLGMKQRLGIAITLIGNPEFLMLDEPINGLDPTGVVEVRNLLISLCENENKTILISSHNLPELYQVATDYIILHKGEIRQVISHQELKDRCRCYLALSGTDIPHLVTVLEQELHTSNYKVMPDNRIQLYDFLEERETLGKVLFENDVVITEMALCENSLEEYFLQVIGGSQNV